MRLSRTDQLALQRRLLVLDASIKRLQLQRDAGRFGALVQPTALARRAWRAARRQPSLLLLAPLAWVAMRHRFALRLASVLPLLWRAWRGPRS